MDWKHTFLFLVVAIPSVAILTRVIAWMCRKKTKAQSQPGAEPLEAPVAKPYATYEEYKKDLRGTVDLDVFLARCRAGVPEDPEKASLTRSATVLELSAAAREKLAGIRARLDRTPVSFFPNAAVPVARGGVGGDGSGGARITGVGSPPPAHEQPQLPKTCSECNGVGTHLFLPCTGQWMLNVPR
jgi:hypothetical protein